jgi:hypothetical protein
MFRHQPYSPPLFSVAACQCGGIPARGDVFRQPASVRCIIHPPG